MPTTPIKQARRQFDQSLARKADIVQYDPGLMGDGQGNVRVTTLQSHAYVRVGDEEAAAKVLNQKVPYINDLAVWIGVDPVDGIYQVMGVRSSPYLDSDQDYYAPVPEHAESHSWEGDAYDLVWVHWNQITNLMVFPTGTWEVTLSGDYIRYPDGSFDYVSSQSIDLGPSGLNLVPGAGGRMVLLYVDDSGTLGTRAGSIVTIGSLGADDIPTTNHGELPVAAVRLYSSQTSIRMNKTTRDIIQLRWPQVNTADHELISDEHEDVAGAPAIGDVLRWSGSVWYPTPPPTSGGGGGGTATEVAFGPRWHVDGPLAVVDDVDGVWVLTEDWRIENVHLYVKTLGTAGSTIIDVEKSTDEGNTWTSMFPAGNPEIAFDNTDHVVVVAPPSVQLLSSGTLLRVNIDQVASGARGMDVEIDGYASEVLVSGSLLPIMGIS